jgi:hypothetical protein
VTDFKKNACGLIFMKIRSVVAELFHADGQTDMTKLIVALRDFENVPKNVPPSPAHNSAYFCQSMETAA